jgi:hypothetical protein
MGQVYALGLIYRYTMSNIKLDVKIKSCNTPDLETTFYDFQFSFYSIVISEIQRSLSVVLEVETLWPFGVPPVFGVLKHQTAS